MSSKDKDFNFSLKNNSKDLDFDESSWDDEMKFENTKMVSTSKKAMPKIRLNILFPFACFWALSIKLSFILYIANPTTLCLHFFFIKN